jgi:PAS domain S-box-containing protein
MVTLTRKTRERRWLALVAGLVIALSCFTGVGFLAKFVADDLSLLDSANSDNIQWTLGQIEVEFLEFDARLTEASFTPDSDLKPLRQRFDVFYSRIATLSKGRLYGGLREGTETDSALKEIETFINETVSEIDSSDTVLRSLLPEMVKRSKAIRADVRKLANSSLAYFANLSDNRRQDVAQTLGLLALVVATLILLLATLVLYLARVNARRLERQQEILEVNTRINTIISTSLDAVIVADQTGKILEFNPAAEEIFGHKAAEVYGRNIGDVVVPPHLLSQHKAGMERIRTKSKRRFVGQGRTQLEGLRSNGEIFPVELALQSAQTDEGELFIAFLRDISALVAAENELVSARDRALAGEKAKSDFLAVMSHEIRTPLNGLLGNLSLLQDTDVSEAQQAYLHNMETSGRLLMSHVTDVLDISRYDAGGIERQLRPMRLDPFLQDMVDNQAGQAEVQNTRLSWQWIGASVPIVNSDPDLLQPILLNLISNAVKFTRNGTVTVEAEVINGSDTLPEIEFRVIDTGIGMSEDVRAKIFDDFVTGSAAYNRQAGGTGLGLGIAKRFVTTLQGEIGCESEPGEGTLFWVRLPFQAVAEPTHLEPIKLPLDDRAMDILVVEDNVINRQVVREMLQSMGHTVTEASHGQAGVECAAQRKFNLILMDISMPIMDGQEATRAIRSGVGQSANSPIIALTAHVMEGDREKFLGDGMNDILTKPLSRLLCTDREGLRLLRGPLFQKPMFALSLNLNRSAKFKRRWVQKPISK